MIYSAYCTTYLMTFHCIWIRALIFSILISHIYCTKTIRDVDVEGDIRAETKIFHCYFFTT